MKPKVPQEEYLVTRPTLVKPCCDCPHRALGEMLSNVCVQEGAAGGYDGKLGSISVLPKTDCVTTNMGKSL